MGGSPGNVKRLLLLQVRRGRCSPFCVLQGVRFAALCVFVNYLCRVGRQVCRICALLWTAV